MDNELKQQEVELKKIRRKAILNFEEALSKFPDVKYGDMEECPLTHRFTDGCYIREIFIPKDTLVVGKIHKHSHPNFLIKGEVTVLTESGGRERLKAPLSMISPAGTKRIVYAHEDTVWQTVHVTNETDIDKIEEEIIMKDYSRVLSEEVKGEEVA